MSDTSFAICISTVLIFFAIFIHSASVDKCEKQLKRIADALTKEKP